MLDFLVFMLQFGYYFILFSFIPTMMVIRFFTIKKEAFPLLIKILIVADITSLSYFYFAKPNKLYALFMYIFFGFSFLALAFGIHMYF